MALLYLVCEAIEKLKWDAFSKDYIKEKYSNLTSLNNLALEFLNKSETDCKSYIEKCKNDIKIIQHDFVSFSEKCSEKSDVCRYWDGFKNLSTLLKSLITCDRVITCNLLLKVCIILCRKKMRIEYRLNTQIYIKNL